MSQTQEAVAQPRTAAGVLIFDEAGRALPVNPTYKQGWEMPGGYLRPGRPRAKASPAS